MEDCYSACEGGQKNFLNNKKMHADNQINAAVACEQCNGNPMV